MSSSRSTCSSVHEGKQREAEEAERGRAISGCHPHVVFSRFPSCAALPHSLLSRSFDPVAFSPSFLLSQKSPFVHWNSPFSRKRRLFRSNGCFLSTSTSNATTCRATALSQLSQRLTTRRAKMRFRVASLGFVQYFCCFDERDDLRSDELGGISSSAGERLRSGRAGKLRKSWISSGKSTLDSRWR